MITQGEHKLDPLYTEEPFDFAAEIDAQPPLTREIIEQGLETLLEMSKS